MIDSKVFFFGVLVLFCLIQSLDCARVRRNAEESEDPPTKGEEKAGGEDKTALPSFGQIVGKLDPAELIKQMELRLAIFLCLCFAAVILALPSESEIRLKRDVMDSMKNAWNEVVKTLSNAGDAVVHVFKPTEKNFVEKMIDGVKSLAD